MCGAIRDISQAVINLIGYNILFIRIYTLKLYHCVSGSAVPMACLTRIQFMSKLLSNLRLIVTTGRVYLTVFADRLPLLSNFSSLSTMSFT